MTVRIYKNVLAGQVFAARGTVGAWPFHCLQAIGNGDGTVSIKNKARSYESGSDFFEFEDVPFAEYVDESDTAWGATEVETVNGINAMLIDSDPGGVSPVYTAATTLSVTDAEALNYFAEATGAVGWEWANLPAGLAVSSFNPRNLVGTFTDGAGVYTADVTAVNYYGSTTTTITFTVTTAFSDTRSVRFENNDYADANALTSNPLYRPPAGGVNTWTISMWLKPSANNKQQTLLYFGGDDVDNEGSVWVTFEGNGDYLGLRYGSKNNNLTLETANNTLPSGTWAHVLITYDGGTTGNASGSILDYYNRFEVFIDGASSSITGSNDNYGWTGEVKAEEFKLGEYANSGKHSRNCLINELALWDTDETANIAAIYNSGSPHDLSLLTSAPNHWWRMGDGDTFPDLQDSSGAVPFTMFNMTAAEIVSDAP